MAYGGGGHARGAKLLRGGVEVSGRAMAVADRIWGTGGGEAKLAQISTVR